jgi:hypothetical protein
MICQPSEGRVEETSLSGFKGEIPPDPEPKRHDVINEHVHAEMPMMVSVDLYRLLAEQTDVFRVLGPKDILEIVSQERIVDDLRPLHPPPAKVPGCSRLVFQQAGRRPRGVKGKVQIEVKACFEARGKSGLRGAFRIRHEEHGRGRGDPPFLKANQAVVRSRDGSPEIIGVEDQHWDHIANSTSVCRRLI